MAGYFSSWAFSPDPLPYAFNIVVAAVLYTWVYNTQRSVLSVVLFHFPQNATGNSSNSLPGPTPSRPG